MVAILLLCALVITGCRRTVSEGAVEPRAEERIVSQVLTTDSPSRLEVRWFPSGCEEFDSIEVTETTDSVSLLINAFVDTEACELSSGESSTFINLDSPLGDRDVFDANPFIDDDPIVLNAGTQPPELDE